MIVGYIKGQSLSLSSPTIASGTIDHLTAFFTFLSSEWEECNEIWVHFSQGDKVYDAEVIEGKVNKNQHINLEKGEWEVYLHGNVNVNGEVIERITTEKETLFVKESGIIDGNPFPSVEESTAEKFLAKAQFAVDEVERLEDKIEESAITPEQEAQIQSNSDMIDNILLYGRNLLKNGGLISHDSWLSSGLSVNFDNGYMEISKAETSGRANLYQSVNQNPLLSKSENAEMYTISIEVMKLSGVEIPANSSFEIHFGGTTKRLIAKIPTDLSEGVWTKIKATTPNNFEPSGNMVARINVGKNAGGFACRNAKLESWTSALEFLNEKINNTGTNGSGLTEQQKKIIGKLGESGKMLTYDKKKIVDSSVLAVVEEMKQLDSLGDNSLLCYVLTDRIGFTPMTLEAGVQYGGLDDYKDREAIYIDPLLKNFFPCSAFTVTTENVLFDEPLNKYCHYELSTDGSTYFYFKYFVNNEPLWMKLYNTTDNMLIVDGVTFPVGWSEYSFKYNEISEIPIFTDPDYYLYFDINSLKFSNDDYFDELQNVFSAERTYGQVRGYYQYYNFKWQKINFGRMSVISNSTPLTTDPTLSIEGAAADAKATGDRFAEHYTKQEIDDKGFITEEDLPDIPESDLSQFIEEVSGSANLYPPMMDGWTDNASIKSDGSESPNASGAYCITPQITVKPETVYTIKPIPWGNLGDKNKGRCYDAQGNALAQVVWAINGDSATFTTPANTAYVRFSVFKTDFDNTSASPNDIEITKPIFNNTFMLVEGTTAPEKYEPYGQVKYRLKGIEIPLKSVNLENVNDKALPIFAPLAGKKIANFGDSIFGNARPPEDVSTYLAEKTGAEVLNCAFGGCRMAIHSQLGHWNAFTMVQLAQAISSGDYSVQDEALNYEDRTSYAEQPLSVIKATDFSTVDILTIAYGTNDFTSNIPLDNAEDPYDTATLAGALRTSIESLLTAYPNLKIFVLSTMYRFYIDENNEFTEDSNTKVNSIGLKLGDYNAKLKEVAEEYNLPYVDDYNIGIGKFNRSQYFPVTDGTHHNEKGRKLIAENLAKQLY